MKERFLREIMKMVKCVACGRRYSPGSVSVLGRHHELWFLSVSCSHCHNQGLVAALIRERKVEAVSTDLTEEDLVRLREGSPVVADDVLDMHRFLTDFDGDFTKLFKADKEAR